MKLNLKSLASQTIEDKLEKMILCGTSGDDCGICGCACKDPQTGQYSETWNASNGVANKRAGKSSPNGGILHSDVFK